MMDDTGDTGTGVNDGFNGDTKPDPTKLAHSAIIKQVGIYYFYSSTLSLLRCQVYSIAMLHSSD